jgi:hypothetical protein
MKFNQTEWASEGDWVRSTITSIGDQLRCGKWVFYKVTEDLRPIPMILIMFGTWEDAYARANMHLRDFPGDYILALRPPDAKSS